MSRFSGNTIATIQHSKNQMASPWSSEGEVRDRPSKKGGIALTPQSERGYSFPSETLEQKNRNTAKFKRRGGGFIKKNQGGKYGEKKKKPGKKVLSLRKKTLTGRT